MRRSLKPDLSDINFRSTLSNPVAKILPLVFLKKYISKLYTKFKIQVGSTLFYIYRAVFLGPVFYVSVNKIVNLTLLGPILMKMKQLHTIVSTE
jgi:hypothetical protein